MWSSALSVAAFVASATVAMAQGVTFEVRLTPPLPFLSPMTRALLESPIESYTARIINKDGFVFHNITSGSYRLDVQCVKYLLGGEPGAWRVDVDTSATTEAIVKVHGTFRDHEWDVLGQQLDVHAEEERHWVQLGGAQAKQFYTERSGFSPLSILRNPMILIGGVSMLFILGVPWMMDRIDPELKAEFEAVQKEGGGLSALLTGAATGNGGTGSFDAAAWLAGKPTDAKAPPARGIKAKT